MRYPSHVLFSLTDYVDALDLFDQRVAVAPGDVCLYVLDLQESREPPPPSHADLRVVAVA